MIVWRMTADTAMKFYERCVERNAQTEEERVQILKELKDEMLSVSVTKRTTEQLIEDLKQHGDILVVRPNGSASGFRPEENNTGTFS
jgi:signal recognition particle GTPase